jgi:hypothetical protein
MIEIYNINKTYLEGWYSITDLKRIIETAERIDEVNKQLAKEAAPEGFKTMEETAAPIVELGWQTNRKGPQ